MPTDWNVRDKPLNEQQELVVKLKEQEQLVDAEVGRRLGVSRMRARQIYAEARERLDDFARHGQESLLLLPKPARELVKLYQLGNRTEIRRAIEAGRLRWNWKQGRVGLDNEWLPLSGWEVWVVLHVWAGLPSPKPAGSGPVPARIREN